MGLSRKEFLQCMLGLTGGLVVGSSMSPARGSKTDLGALPELPQRKLGSTGQDVPLLGLGGYHFAIPEDEKTARQTIESALDQGMRFFDNAESYHSGKAERWMGAAIAGRRKEVYLMTKTHDFPARTAEGAKRHLEGSLDRLKTDYLDLWQLHSVRSVEDVDHAFRAGGAMEYIRDAKRQGLVRHIGVTGHTDAQANQRALKYFDEGWHFDAFQFPINPIDFHQQSFQREFLPEVVKRGIAVLAMKTAAAGTLIDRNLCTVEECLRFVMALPVSVIISGMASVDHLRHNCRIVRGETPFTAAESEALLERLKPSASLDLESYKRTA